jgi:hypothetical protein
MLRSHTGPIAGTEMGRYGPFRALGCQILDERERTEARSVYARAQIIRVVASAQIDRRSGVGSRQPSTSGEPGSPEQNDAT